MTPIDRLTIESLAKDLGLELKEHPLKSKPHCTHWHLSKPNERGTLEITLDEASHEAEIVVRSNRQGTWTADAASTIAQALDSRVPSPESPWIPPMGNERSKSGRRGRKGPARRSLGEGGQQIR